MKVLIIPSQEVGLDQAAGGQGVRGWRKLYLLGASRPRCITQGYSLLGSRGRGGSEIVGYLCYLIYLRNWTNRDDYGNLIVLALR